MKRLVFFLILVGGITGVSCLLLFDGSFRAWDVLGGAFESVKAGTWPWESFNFATVFVYGLAVFFLVNAILLLSLAVMGLTTLFRFTRVYKFYATMWWYLFAAIVFTCAFIYFLIESARITSVDVLELLKSFSWIVYMPLGSAIALVILGTIFKRTEKI